MDGYLIGKVKDIATGTRQVGGVINRRQIWNIDKGVIRENNPDILKKFGGTVELTDRWARSILTTLNWSKRKGTTGKVKTSSQFLEEEIFTFQWTISAAVSCHYIPDSLVLNNGQNPLAEVSPGNYTFSSKGAKNVPIKGVDNKRQAAVTFAVSSKERFWPMQLIHTGKTQRWLLGYHFPATFSLSFTKNYWSNTEWSIEFFKEIIILYLKKVKKEKRIYRRITFTCYYRQIQTTEEISKKALLWK